MKCNCGHKDNDEFIWDKEEPDNNIAREDFISSEFRLAYCEDGAWGKVLETDHKYLGAGRKKESIK